MAAPFERRWADFGGDDIVGAVPTHSDDLLRGLRVLDVDLRSDPRFATHRDRQANDAALTEALADVLSRRGKDVWQEELISAGVACVSVTTGPPEALLAGEDYGRAGGYIVNVTHPVFGDHPRLAPVVRFSRSSTQAKPGCLCGDATDRVLAELGYRDYEIARLRARRIID